jgi:hypothetical protein
LVPVKGDWRKESQFSQTTHRIWLLVKGDWRKESQFSLTTSRIWVLVKEDWLKESQFIPTTHSILVMVKGIGERNLRIGNRNLSFAKPHTGFWFSLKVIGERNLSLAQPQRILVRVKRDWRKSSQFSPTRHRIWVLVKGN